MATMQEFISGLKGDFTPEQASALQLYNAQLVNEFRSNQGVVQGDFAGAPLLILNHIGAKSQERRSTPLVFSKDRERFIIIASKAGLDTHPAWYFNLLAHPQVSIEVGGQTIEVTAELAQGEERQRLFEEQAKLMPVFLEYQKKTARQLPVFILQARP